MLRIWGRNNSINVQKVMWTVGELGLDHERRDVGGAFGGLDTLEYGAMNPNRLIPVLDDGGMLVWESNAVVRYLAAKYGAGGLWPEEPAERSLADRWMDWMITTILPDMHPIFLGLIRTPEDQRDMALITAAAERLGKRFLLFDQHLDGWPFVAGEAFTMGDIPMGAACYRYHALPIERPALPNVAAWYDRLQARDAFREHVMIPLT